MLPEDIQLVYESQLMDSPIQQLLVTSRQKDLAWQRTSVGIHRDEIEINLGSQLFRNIASQGQRKSLLFALKLAELDVLKKEKGFAPLLLLDDVFEKLDETRISNLLNKVCTENDGQVFITDTNLDRLDQHLAALITPYQLVGL
jgi:DNA replication and repair protein RecF